MTDDGQNVDTANLGFTTSPHEECALEEAAQIAGREGGDVVVITVGPSAAEEQLRYAASVGGTGLVLIPNNTGNDWDPQRTATVIGEAIVALEAEGGAFDLIMFGNESADAGGFQVGVRVAHKLGRPIVNGIKGIEVREGGFTARRDVDTGSEVYELDSPAVMGIKEGINVPRYPTMKGRLASKKAQMKVMELDAVAGGQTKIKLHRPDEKVSETEILGTDEAAARAVVDLLDESGVL